MREKEQQDLMSDREQGWLVDWSYVPVFGSVHIDVRRVTPAGRYACRRRLVLGSWDLGLHAT